jgi:hypothetical protein
VALCNNSISNALFTASGRVKLLHAQSYSQDARHLQVLNLKQTNVFAKYNGQPYRNPLLGSSVQLVNVVCTISGNSFFGQNFGSSVISAVSSNLIITGNLTVSDGQAFLGREKGWMLPHICFSKNL